MKAGIAAAFVMTGAITVPTAANASDFFFSFTGPGVSGSLDITYEVNANTGPLPGTSPNPVDPINSYVITGITGTVSSVNLGLTNAAVTGLVGLNIVDPEESNLQAPHSFSLFEIANGSGPPPSAGFHYDNLFYPDGKSPLASSDYPLAGGVFDIYGVMFEIEGGLFANFWSNGAPLDPETGALLAPPDYGIAFTDATDVLDYTGGVAIAAVPEPLSWAMSIAGFALVGSALRRRRTTVRYA